MQVNALYVSAKALLSLRQGKGAQITGFELQPGTILTLYHGTATAQAQVMARIKDGVTLSRYPRARAV